MNKRNTHYIFSFQIKQLMFSVYPLNITFLKNNILMQNYYFWQENWKQKQYLVIVIS